MNLKEKKIEVQLGWQKKMEWKMKIHLDDGNPAVAAVLLELVIEKKTL